MNTIGRNDPCPCGSGKKYKKCCQLKEGAINLETFRYEKYLSVRSSAVEKMIKIADDKIGIDQTDIVVFLTDSPLFNKRNINLFSYSEDEAFVLQYILNSLLVYAYPVGNKGDQLWRACLENYRDRFSQEEIDFLNSLENHTAGFFQAKEVDCQKYLIVAQDIFTLKTYNIMDRGMSSDIVRNDVFVGMLAPYSKDIYILEAGTPILFPPMEKGYISKTADRLYALNRRKIKGSREEILSGFLNLYPVNMYRIVLDYYYITQKAPLPKLMTTDNEELLFSKTFYNLSDMEEVKNSLLRYAGFTISEENKEEIIISWRNRKDIILGTVFISRNGLRFETNSEERLSKWKSIAKKLPVEFVKTEYMDPEDLMEEMSRNPISDIRDQKEEKTDGIPVEAMEEIALDYWDRYYNDWVNIRIPFLGNKTPLEAIKTDEGKQKVIDLIDDYENKNLHMVKKSGWGNIQRFFNADELRKRLNL